MNHSLLLLICCALSCSIGYGGNSNIIFCGKIQNAKKSKVELSCIEWFEENEMNYEAEIDKEGTFRFDFTSKNPMEFFLTVGKNRTELYLIPGDSVFLTCDWKEFYETIHYSGEGSDKCNFFAEYLLKFKSDKSFFDVYDYSIEACEYKRKRLDFKAQELEFLYHYEGLSKQSTEYFKNYIEDSASNNFVIYIINFMAAKYGQFRTLINDYGIPEEIDCIADFLDSLDINQPEALIAYNYRRFVGDYMTFYLLPLKIFKKESPAYNDPSFNSINELYAASKQSLTADVFDFFVTKTILTYYKPIDSLKNRPTIESFFAECKNQEYIELIRRKIVKETVGSCCIRL